jgi:radical SAM superfamily enzyme YgiQ (UPF0313 family)
VKRCKLFGKRVVLGGPYVTTTIEDLPDADHIFVGEAETTLPQFVKDLARELQNGATRQASVHRWRRLLSPTFTWRI